MKTLVDDDDLEPFRAAVRRKYGRDQLAAMAAKAKMPVETYVTVIAAVEQHEADQRAARRRKRAARLAAKPKNTT